MQRLLILGAGGFAAAVAEAAVATGEFRIVGFLDDRYPEILTFQGLPVLGRLDLAPPWTSLADVAIAAFGQASLRRKAAARIHASGLNWCKLVHPRALLSPSATLGPGTIVMAGAIVGARCRVDEGALINAGAVLDHDVRIGAYAHLAVGSCVGGGGQLLPDATLGPGLAVASGQCHPTTDGHSATS